MTSFALKVLACISMFLDHVGYVIFGRMSFLNYIGRLAFPIFAYQISEGYSHTKNLKKYFLRLFVFAIVSQVPFSLFHSILNGSYLALNVMFTLLLGLVCIYIWDKCPNKILSCIVLASSCLLAEFCKMDYGYFGVLVVFVFYLFKHDKALLASSFFALLLIKFLPNIITYNFYYKYVMLLFCTFAAIVPILLYNGKQGKKIKYFLYVFYPVHLLVLYFVNMIP